MSQKERLLRYLSQGNKISSYDAYKDFGITQLATRIFELKEMGYDFDTKTVQGINRFGEQTHWTEYQLKELELGI